MLGGLRQSEILTLKAEDLQEDGVFVRTSWDRETKKLVPPKNGKPRFVALALPVTELLARLSAAAAPTKEGYLFPNARLNGPVDHKVVNARFFAALSKVEIDEGTRKARNVTFHS